MRVQSEECGADNEQDDLHHSILVITLSWLVTWRFLTLFEKLVLTAPPSSLLPRRHYLA